MDQTIFLVFGLKLNMTFNLNEAYFSEVFAIWRYWTSKLSKNEVFGHFLDFTLLVFLDCSTLHACTFILGWVNSCLIKWLFKGSF